MKAIYFLLSIVFAVFSMVELALVKAGAILFAVDNQMVANATTYSIRSLHDFHFKKSVMEKLYQTYGDGWNALDILRSLGRYKTVSNETMTAEEEGYNHRTITIGSSNVTPAGGAGLTASFELDADDLDADDRYYPREGFSVYFGNTNLGFIDARITDITAAGSTVTLTVKPYDATKTLSASYVYAGAEVAIGDYAAAAETGQPPATSKGYFEREFYAQIYKETLTFGGMELAKQKWVEIAGLGFFNKEFARVEFLLDRQEEVSLIMGQKNTNSITEASAFDSGNVPVYKNKGLWTWIDELGGEVTYTDAAGLAMDDFDTMAEYLESQGVTHNVVLMLGGGSFMRRVENMGIEFISNTTGGSTSAGLPGEFVDKFRADGPSDPSMDINVGFRGIKKAGHYFVMHTLPIFTNPFVFGIDGYMLKDSAMCIPLTKVKDRKSGLTIPNLQAYYVGLGAYSRKRVVATLAGMDGFGRQMLGYPIISELDGFNTYWLSHVMFPFMEANKSLLLKRTS